MGDNDTLCFGGFWKAEPNYIRGPTPKTGAGPETPALIRAVAHVPPSILGAGNQTKFWNQKQPKMEKQLKTFTKTKQGLVEEFVKDIEYMSGGIADCVRSGDDGFLEAIISISDEIRGRCKTIMEGLNPPHIVVQEDDILEPDPARKNIKLFLSLKIRSLPRDVLYQDDATVKMYLEEQAIEDKSIRFLYNSRLDTFCDELDQYCDELLPVVRERHRQPGLFENY